MTRLSYLGVVGLAACSPMATCRWATSGLRALRRPMPPAPTWHLPKLAWPRPHVVRLRRRRRRRSTAAASPSARPCACDAPSSLRRSFPDGSAMAACRQVQSASRGARRLRLVADGGGPQDGPNRRQTASPMPRQVRRCVRLASSAASRRPSPAGSGLWSACRPVDELKHEDLLAGRRHVASCIQFTIAAAGEASPQHKRRRTSRGAPFLPKRMLNAGEPWHEQCPSSAVVESSP